MIETPIYARPEDTGFLTTSVPVEGDVSRLKDVPCLEGEGNPIVV